MEELTNIEINPEILMADENDVMSLLLSDNHYWYKVDQMLNPFTCESLYEEIDGLFEDMLDEWNYIREQEYYANLDDIQEAMRIHSQKRMNRKFMAKNRFKNKIKDKRNLFLKAVKEEIYSDTIYSSKNILRVEPILEKAKKVYKFKSYEIVVEPFIAVIKEEYVRNFSGYNSLNFIAYGMLDYIKDGFLQRIFYKAVSDIYPYQEIFVDYLTGKAIEIPEKYSIISYRPDLNSVKTINGYKKEWSFTLDTPFNAKRNFYGKSVQGFHYCHGISLFRSHQGDYYDWAIEPRQRINSYIQDSLLKDGLDEYLVNSYSWDAFDEYSTYQDDEISSDDWFVPSHVIQDDYWNEDVLFWEKPDIESWNIQELDSDFDYDHLYDDDYDHYEQRFDEGCVS